MFRFNWLYKPGKDNAAAAALSRHPPEQAEVFSANIVVLLGMQTRSGQRSGLHLEHKPQPDKKGRLQKRLRDPQPDCGENSSTLAHRERNTVPSEGCSGDPAASNAARPPSQRDTSAVTGTASGIPIRDVWSLLMWIWLNGP